MKRKLILIIEVNIALKCNRKGLIVVLVHLEKKFPKRPRKELTTKQKQSLVGLLILLAVLLVTLCVVVLVRLDKRKDDSILKLAEVEDYTKYTEKQFKEITNNDDYEHLGWFYYNLTDTQKNDILFRFPYLKKQTIQKYDYVDKKDVTENMEIVGTDKYNGTKKVLVREYVSPIETAKESYEETYQRYVSAKEEMEENGTYDAFVEENKKALQDDTSTTVYKMPDVLYKWYGVDDSAENFDENGSKDEIILKPGSLSASFRIGFKKFGTSKEAIEFSDNYADLRDNFGAKVNSNQRLANTIINELSSTYGNGAKITVKLSANERQSDEETKDDKKPGVSGKDVQIDNIYIDGSQGNHNLTLSAYDQYLQEPAGVLANEAEVKPYRTKTGSIIRNGENNKPYYSKDVAIMDFCYEIPENYVVNGRTVALGNWTGARFSTNTYNYARTTITIPDTDNPGIERHFGNNKILAFADNPTASQRTLGFYWDNGYSNDMGLLQSSILENGNIQYGATQAVTKITEKLTNKAKTSQIGYDEQFDSKQNYAKKDKNTSTKLDNFSIQVNLHENTTEGWGRDDATKNADGSHTPDLFLRKFLSNHQDNGAQLYILLGKNEETLKRTSGGISTTNALYKLTNGNKKQVALTETLATGTTGSTYDMSGLLNYRLVGHKMTYITVERGNADHSKTGELYGDGKNGKDNSNHYLVSDKISVDNNNCRFEDLDGINYFTWGIGYLGKFDSLKLSQGFENSVGNKVHKYAQGIWIRTPRTDVTGEEKENPGNNAKISYKYNSNSTISELNYHFINQCFNMMADSPTSNISYHFDNQSPKFRIGVEGSDNKKVCFSSIMKYFVLY